MAFIDADRLLVTTPTCMPSRQQSNFISPLINSPVSTKHFSLTTTFLANKHQLATKTSTLGVPSTPPRTSSSTGGESSQMMEASLDVPPSLVCLLQRVGQEHLLAHLEALPGPEERQQLLKELMVR